MKKLILALLMTTNVAYGSYGYIHPTQKIDHIYFSIMDQPNLHMTLMRCGEVGYERDRSVDVQRLTDDEQNYEMYRQVNRCICYMEFINEVYPEQVAEEVRTEKMLKELVASTQFVQLENHSHYYQQFRESPYIMEDAKFAIAYNTKNQCGLDYKPK